MANNRMYIREKRTGEMKLLCKFYPSTCWYQHISEQDFNEWLHVVTEACVLQHNADNLFGPSSFELVFEHVEEGRDETEI